MRTNIRITDQNLRDEPQYALRQGLGFWEVTFEGRHATFQHEEGAPYVAWLLLHPPPKPIHALGVALNARSLAGQIPGAAEVIQQRYLGLDEAGAVQTLRRRERELEAVLDDDEEIEPVKAEALRELEAIYDFMRKNPWRSRDCVQKCARAVSCAIRCLQANLAGAVDGEGKPDPVLRAFAGHLEDHLLIPSDGGGLLGRMRVGAALPGWFIYEPPAGLVWEIRGQKSEVGSQRSEVRRTEAVGYLARFLCVGFALGLLATGCAGPQPLKGGRAVMTHTPAGVVEQTLTQGENPSQASKQTQETVKVRTYTLPVGSRIEQSQVWEGERPREPKLLGTTAEVREGEVRVGEIRARGDARPPVSRPSTLNSQPSTAHPPSTTFILSSPMPVVEREETHARTELGAAQKDTAREIGAKLASLKGIVWVGVGMFVFGLASLVWPPLKAVIGSVTTSAALMLGGVALMVLPTLVVGNELLILGGVGLGVGGWFLAHRHGQLRGIISASANTSGGRASPRAQISSEGGESQGSRGRSPSQAPGSPVGAQPTAS